MQTVDDKRRWFAGNAWKARAIAFTTRRMTYIPHVEDTIWREFRR
jgi:hypothetical protein